MRKYQLLTDDERKDLFQVPTNRDDLVRLFTLDTDDMERIRIRRENRNRLGVAIQLALFRHPGVTLAQYLADHRSLPVDFVQFLAEQIYIPPAAFADYGQREQTMTDHARELARDNGLRQSVNADLAMMIDAASEAAWSTNDGVTIARAIVTAMRGAGVLLPSVTTIERAGLAGRSRARKMTAHALVDDLTPSQLAQIDALCAHDREIGQSRLAWLKASPISPRPEHIRDIISRLTYVRAICLPERLRQAVHIDRYRQFLREGRTSSTYMIDRYTESRRRAMLVVLLLDFEERLADAAIDMADKLIATMFTRARNIQTRRYSSTAKDVARLMRLFCGTIDALSEAAEKRLDPMETLDQRVGWLTLLMVRPEVHAIAATADEDPLVAAGGRYITLRKFAPALIEALEFRSGRGSARTIAAIGVLRELNRTGQREVPADAPMPFKKDWRSLVRSPDGTIDRRLYEVATLAHLRNKLRSGDVWLDRSADYRRFDTYLLPQRAAAPIVAELGLPPTADEWLERRGRELDARLKRFSAGLREGAYEGVTLVGRRLSISPVKPTTPPAAEKLADQLEALLPRVRITELLHDVARDTGMLNAFTNLRTGEKCPSDNALLAVILADATNLGLTRMAAASHGVTRDQLIWTKDAYFREDTYKRALACVINAHTQLPIVSHWGDGTTSSSDGQFFRSGKRVHAGSEVNARYGGDPGFSFYTHVSDQHGSFHVRVISAATHEAPYVLDGLLHHGTTLNIAEHYTDTGGATDHVFALCAMLGFRFCPRLRDFPDRRLVPLEAPGSYPELTPLLGKRIRAGVIRDHWGEVLRLVASLKSGETAPSTMMRKLAAYERQNQIDIAVQEIGKIERTLFMLDWLENPDLRRRCQAGLNKSEQRHALTQAICTYRQGRIVDRSHSAQQYRASGLNLAIASIIYWNSVYMTEAITHLRTEGRRDVSADLLAHTSPLGWEHIAFSGDFHWDRAAVATSERKLNVRPVSTATA